MTATCPYCGSYGQPETAGPKATAVMVRWCPACNVVFDGLAPSGYQPPNSHRGERMTETAWADAAEDARAALERARIVLAERRADTEHKTMNRTGEETPVPGPCEPRTAPQPAGTNNGDRPTIPEPLGGAE